jgi:hypothetical protein
VKGPEVRGTARLLAGVEADEAHGLLAAKYGIQLRLLQLVQLRSHSSAPRRRAVRGAPTRSLQAIHLRKHALPVPLIAGCQPEAGIGPLGEPWEAAWQRA